MNKTYIEKEAAIQKFSEEIYAACGNTLANGLTYGRRLLDAIHPADVVPVVRCKDCKHSKDMGYANLCWCNEVNDSRPKDWYCADGKRREE